MPQGDIAAMAAMSRSSLVKVLAAFRGQGWIENRYARIIITDADAMRRDLGEADTG